MYDTIGIKSPYISEKIARIIENECIKRSGLDLRTGEILYEITTQQLLGSYDSKVHIKIDRMEYETVKLDKIHSLASGNKNIPVLKRCEPYIYVECSIHKLLLGHNCFGGPDNFNLCCKYIVTFLEKEFSISLPDYSEWKVKRVDVANCFDLGNPISVQEYFRGLNNANYPRRQVNKFGLSGLYASGSTTTLKFYHKGIEFRKHDLNRLKKFMDYCDIIKIEEKAMNILRVECEVKIRKLKNDFKKDDILVGEISDNYLNCIYDIEVNRLLKEGNNKMKCVRDVRDVKNRLLVMYGNKLGNTILNTWFQLTTLGENIVKASMSKTTYYNHIKYLKNANVSWLNTDVIVMEKQYVPNDFFPLRKDERNLLEVDKLVQEKLKLIA